MVVNNADVRNLDLGRCTHFSSHSIYPRHHVCFICTFIHHPRIINCLQRSSLALGLWFAVLISRRN